MKFSRVSSVLVTAVLFFVVVVGARAGDAAADATEQVRAFYKFYLHALNADDAPLAKSHAGMKRYISDRFLSEVDRAMKVEGGLEADPFICAQDFDKAWEKNILVKDPVIDGGKATVKVTLSGGEMTPQRLKLKLVNAGGAWKIDFVDNAETP